MSEDAIEQARQALYKEMEDASARLKKIVDAGGRSAMGLLPEKTRLDPKYRKAKAEFDRAFQAVRKFNTKYKPKRRPRFGADGKPLNSKANRNMFAARILGTRVISPTPLSWVYLIKEGREALWDFLNSDASDAEKCRWVQKNYADYCTYGPAVDPELLTGPGTVWELCTTRTARFLILVVTQTTYEDGYGGTEEPSTVNTTEEQLRLRRRGCQPLTSRN